MAMTQPKDAPAPSVSNNDIDERTVFVRSLPFTVTDAQLEDVFSEVGPVRNCFTVKEKGTEEHRGFGFVHFAVKEDAIRAVEAKNGSTLQGRKLKVELAKRRAPLDARHPRAKRKDADGNDEGGGGAEAGAVGAEPNGKETKKRKVADDEYVQPNIESAQVVVKKKSDSGKQPRERGVAANTKKRPREEGKASESQRPARTVVVGCLENPKMVEAVISKANKLGLVEAVRHPLPEAELVSRGLAQDGCKQGAAAIVYTSVNAAIQAVAALHKQNFGGAIVWARQLGGEGAKLKKWRLIVRNLPFMLKDKTLRDLFSPSGFVWEITIPRNPDNSSKGFAFVGFTCKADAEKAIKAVNGKLVSKRPVAVDWAVAKKDYETVVAKTAHPNETHHDDDSTSESETGSGVGNGYQGEYEEDVKAGAAKPKKKLKVDASSRIFLDQQKATKKAVLDSKSSIDEDNSSESNLETESSDGEDDSSKNNGDFSAEPFDQSVDFAREQDLLKRVLEKVVTNGKQQEPDELQLNSIIDNKGQEAVKHKGQANYSRIPPVTQGVKELKQESEKHDPPASTEDSLKRTVFVRNLPLDTKVLDMRRQFSAFGEVKSFRLVLHPITKRPKGTAFVEFASAEGAEGAIKAAEKSEEDGGLVLGGRKIGLNLALDRDQAKQVAKQMSKEQDDHDRRHLKLAKEGLILEGTPAAQGVSKADMMKRKQVEHEKATKLRSPNFHVSTTRLAVHNVPKDMSEKDLKQLFIKAVKSRASKQQPGLKQVKILRDEVKGIPNSGDKSRGAAFVEFTEHQHALVALRVLNNNPGTFGPEHRPIIEFAVENLQILKKRAAREAQAKSRLARKGGNINGYEKDREASFKMGSKNQDRKAEQNIAVKKLTARGSVEVNSTETQDRESLAKRKREKRDKNKKLDKKPEGVASKSAVDSNSEVTASMKGKKHIKKRQRRDEVDLGSEVIPVRNRGKRPSGHLKVGKQLEDKDGRDHKARVTSQESPQPLQSGKVHQVKQSTSDRMQQTAAIETRRGRKHQQVFDKLDNLVAEYRSKYFSCAQASIGKGGAQADADLRRWFE